MNRLIVSRLGGNAASSSQEVKKTADVILSDPARRYVIVSAPASSGSKPGITDLLYMCHASFSDKMFGEIAGRYTEIVSGLGIDFDIDAEISALRQSFRLGMNLDYIGSRGEYIMAKIFAQYLGWDFVDAQDILFFDKNGNPDRAKTFRVAGKILKGYERAIIPSFYGSLPDGKIKTFRRGDCDTAGAMVACSVKADLFEKWSDDTKTFSADPSVIPDAKLIRNITYNEAVELNYIGMNISTDAVMFMLHDAGIPMFISGLHAPYEEAVTISPALPPDSSRGVVSCIAGRKGFDVLHVQKYGLNSSYDFCAKLFGIFASHHIPCPHIISGIHQLSLIVKSPRFHISRREIISEIEREINPASVTVEKGLALIAIIGEGIYSASGIFSDIMTALSLAGIKVQVTDQGADKMNMIIGVHDSDYENAVKALYKALIMNERKF